MIQSTCTLAVSRAGLELVSHGTLAFPCAAYETQRTNRIEDEIIWHYHPELECIVVAQGQLQVQVPGKSFLLSAGEGVWINAGILHYAAAVQECQLHSIVFSPSLLFGEESSVYAQKYLLPLTHLTELDARKLTPKATAQKEMLAAFSAAFQALSAEDFGYEFTVRSALSQLCLLLCQENRGLLSAPAQGLPSDAVRIRKMLDYLHAHYTTPIRLCDIAQAGGVGARECLRCFQRTIQTTPIQYLLKYRVMQSATLLLAEPDLGIFQVALRCGFDSLSRYGQLFRRYFSCSPKEYRAAAFR